jgi:hypothetical protein
MSRTVNFENYIPAQGFWSKRMGNQINLKAACPSDLNEIGPWNTLTFFTLPVL